MRKMNAAEAFIPVYSDLECGIAAEAARFRRYTLTISMNAAEAFIPKHSDLECGIAAEAALFRRCALKRIMELLQKLFPL